MDFNPYCPVLFKYTGHNQKGHGQLLCGGWPWLSFFVRNKSLELSLGLRLLYEKWSPSYTIL